MFTVEYFANMTLTGDPVHIETMTNLQAFMIGQIGGGKVDPAAFSLRISGTFNPAASGIHRAGAFATGPARLYVDGKLVVDFWEVWEPGQTFFEEGCDEQCGDIALEAGKPVSAIFEYCTKKSEEFCLHCVSGRYRQACHGEDIRMAVEVARSADIAIVCAGRTGEWDTEGWDLPDITLPGMQDELIAAVAAANQNTIIVLQTGGPVEMPWLDKVSAVLQAWYPGQKRATPLPMFCLATRNLAGGCPKPFQSVLQTIHHSAKIRKSIRVLTAKCAMKRACSSGTNTMTKPGSSRCSRSVLVCPTRRFDWRNLKIIPQNNDFVVEIDVENIGSVQVPILSRYMLKTLHRCCHARKGK